ncbi:MAG: hypothetical protein SVV03_01220 [Candidatus Nanohaloarchaea archaeon]|nr:hypothetical protein [Candidatus Nanohaloarchaea archaeon]
MILFRVENRLGNIIELTVERWNHILRHRVPKDPELLKRALQDPESIIKSKSEEQTNLYYLKHEENYIAVVVQEEQGFIKTAYKTKTKKQGEQIWTR